MWGMDGFLIRLCSKNFAVYLINATQRFLVLSSVASDKNQGKNSFYTKKAEWRR